MTLYQYDSLPDDSSIRVLSLEPAVSHNAPVLIKLETLRISKNLPCPALHYEALSYVWGAAEGNRVVFCDGKRILVTENCESALRQLRRRTRARKLWIDAICIDQRNNKERSQQVDIMDMVFANARRVVVWLGEDPSSRGGSFSSLLTRMYHVMYIFRNSGPILEGKYAIHREMWRVVELLTMRLRSYPSS